MKHYFFLILAVISLAGTQANAQCVYTTTRDGNFSDPTIYTGGCTTAPTAGSTIIINNNIVLNQNFSSTGNITIGATGSLTQDGINRSLAISNGALTVAATASRGFPKLAVAVLDLEKTTLNVGANSVVQITCTLLLGNLAVVNLGNNSLLNVFGNVDVATGNPGIVGPATGVRAGLRITGNIVNNNGGGGNLFTTTGLITCVERNPIPSGCVVTSTNNITPPASNDATCRSVLPVTLTHFGGTRTSESNVELTWATATELNNDYFAVERSTDGNSYETLVRVAGAGTSTNSKAYSFTDIGTFKTLVYYRLRQMDYDGKASYSPVVSIAAVHSTDWLMASASPQHYFIKGTLDANSQLQILDVLGRPVFTEALSPEHNEVTLPALPTGVYLFRLITRQGRFTVRQAITTAL